MPARPPIPVGTSNLTHRVAIFKRLLPPAGQVPHEASSSACHAKLSASTPVPHDAPATCADGVPSVDADGDAAAVAGAASASTDTTIVVYLFMCVVPFTPRRLQKKLTVGLSDRGQTSAARAAARATEDAGRGVVPAPSVSCVLPRRGGTSASARPTGAPFGATRPHSTQTW